MSTSSNPGIFIGIMRDSAKAANGDYTAAGRDLSITKGILGKPESRE